MLEYIDVDKVIKLRVIVDIQKYIKLYFLIINKDGGKMINCKDN